MVFFDLALNSVPFTARLFRRAGRGLQGLSRSPAPGQDSQAQPVSAAARTDGFSYPCSPAGPPDMRDFQFWEAQSGSSVRVMWTPECALALCQWQTLSRNRGSPWGPSYPGRLVTTDASLMGSGGVHEGRCVRGDCSTNLSCLHINFLALSEFFVALRRLLPFLQGHHVLVRTDNSMTVA